MIAECRHHILTFHTYPPADPLRDLIETKKRDSTRWILKSWIIPMVNIALSAVKTPSSSGIIDGARPYKSTGG